MKRLFQNSAAVKKAASALFGPIPLSRDQAMGASERLSAVTSLTAGLEYLTHRDHIRAGGLNDWAIARDAYAGRSRATRKVLDLLAHDRTTTVLHAARVAASAGLLLPGNGKWRGAANAFLGVSGAALYPRHRYGTDGADQASTLVQTATGLARMAPSPQVQDALLWYVALQSNLSYLVSGWVKLLGKDWRDGSALSGVMRTRTYGQKDVWRLTRKYPKSARLLAHGVLALECLFPVLYAKGGALTRPVLASAASFHVANGFVMGLGRFATSFIAMHPMVAYTSAPRSLPPAAGRDDRMLRATAVVAAGSAAAAAAVAVGRRLRATDGWPGTRTVTTRHGNRLGYDPRLTPDGTGPVVVLVPGLISTAEHFSWITEKLLQESRYDVITYNRAGYGASHYHGGKPFTLQESVDDLVDLVTAAVPRHRDVVLAGHSLGGEIARRAAGQLGDRLHSVVYIDSSHPAELQRSSQQSDSAERLKGGLGTFLHSLQAGLGALLVRPEWVHNLPAGVRSKVMAQYADSRMWKAGMREWEATEKEFRAFEGDLAPVGAHALVVSAQQTVDRDPEQLLMHQEIADAHKGGHRLVRTCVVEGSDHDSLLTSPRLGGEVAAQILDFLTATATADSTTEQTTAAGRAADLEEAR
ncbi:alpha/beta fold hydrolase [Streptomyces sp. ACA25]|uniref:alpha/beta fold hydrolase n=1 Tax=Streptomyces sp. ACA25 TaxID=3022596 RepID=UPI002307FC68|nr:alpha/beta fold hydrolase [Streptomyces sp. ACA25]MDB1086070.1 alpha/beta fold hydrolase [Streptomyces sp. ACA25]